jgi:aminoglycoside phosphotransferase family enzyme
VIIDCLDFDRRLRLLDPLAELAFLDLECRRLGNDWIGPQLEASYARLSGAECSAELHAFYGRCHALIRAALAAARMDEPGADLDKWQARARCYLALAAQLRQ